MNKKFKLVTIVALLVLGVAVALIAEINFSTRSKDTANNASNVSPTAQSAGLASEAVATSQPPVAVSGKMKGIAIQDSDIQNLASVVGLQVMCGPNSVAVKSVGKEEWAKSIQQAQELLQGMCSCHQRNWLLQFIDCGNYALAGDPKYNQAVQDLSQVPLTE